VTAADSLFRSFGNLSLPLSATGDTDFSALDPGRTIVLELFRDALNSELEPIWAAAVAGTPLEGSDPVESVLPALPDLTTIQQVKKTFPMLAGGPVGAPVEQVELTLWQEQVTRIWEFDYVLGPLEIGNQLKLDAVLTAVDRILRTVIAEGGHRAYESQTYGNSTFLKKVLVGQGEGLTGFSRVEIVSSVYGAAAFSEGGPKYHAYTLTCRISELDGFTDGEAAPYDGTTFTGNTGDTSGTIPVVIGNTSIPLPD
jgi:hypothetical protein